MYAVEKLSSYITRGVYTVSGPFHPFGGAVDIIVVQQQDGSFKSSPWYVRFGKFQGVLKSKENVVNICVNGAEAGFHMYLDHKGEAYFLKDPKTEEGDFAMSPPSSGDEIDANIQSPRFKKTQSCNIDSSDQSESGTRMDMGNVKVITRASSKRSGILSLMFGRRSMKGNINDPNVHRVSSLERAEIAADLLETRWSTNLPNSDKQMKGSSERDGKDITLSHIEGRPETPHLNEEGHCDESDHTISSRGVNIDENFKSSIISKEQDEEVVHSSPNLEAGEEVIDVGTSDTGNLTSRIEFTTDGATSGIGGSDATLKESNLQDVGVASSVSGMNIEESVGSHGDELSDNHGTNLVTEVLFEERITRTILVRTNEKDPETSSLETNNFGRSNELIFESVTTESERYDVSPRESVLKSFTSNGQRPGLAEPSLGSDSSEHALNDRDRSSTCKFESGEKEVIPFSFSGRTKSFNASIDSAREGSNLAFGSDEQIVHDYEVISETIELISEVKSQPESGVHTDKENLDGCQDRNLENSSISEDTKRNGCSADSPPIAGIGQMFTSHSSPKSNLINSETEVIYQEKEASELSQGREISLEPVEVSGNQTQMNDVGSAGPTNIPTHGFNDKSESKSICSFPDSVHSNDQVQEGLEVEESSLVGGDNVAQEVIVTSVPLGTDKVSVPSSESSEDEQLMFGCIDNIVAEGIDPEQLVKDATTGTDVHSLLTAEDDVEEHEMKDTNDEQSFQSFSEVSRTETSPVTIPRSPTHLTDSEFFISSLPIIRSHIHDLERMDIPHPLSRSLDLRSEKIKQDFVQKETYGSLNLESNSDSFMLQEQLMSENADTAVNDRNWGEPKGIGISPAVELSLCKHLLFERMGSEAASQAFNSEKVNVEKFSTLGPSIVRNERLVVRIGGHYFPWAAAAPIILGMASFGQEDIFEPLGMISVDRADENHKGDAARAIVKSRGSWRLWPFTFRKSETITTVRSAPERSIGADLDTASTNMKELVGSTEKQRKKVPSLTPSSEELASLNLKEGPNVVTFTFSTAMLGRQQVDARIYLWKWNTRIVVSDVDGTITKSDVLGQFMPLVGIDWSQTGVAHLFTAIKENGYQLLFLSARAISQAYLTRQFLFNLKQDGKVLPDGPVVISPDGLFPSLYREVIRRAPHEFKISCLEDIRALFPPDCNPFYAGFGNRHTDEISYLKVGIPKGKIFIINPKGEVAVNRRVDTKSYTSLHALVNGMFPSASSAEQEDFNSWNFWKLPLPDVDI